MPETHERNFGLTASHEGVPQLGIKRNTEAKMVDEVLATENGAGWAELEWVLNPWNRELAQKILNEDCVYFFPNVIRGDSEMAYVYWKDNRFNLGWVRCTSPWDSEECIVIVN